MNKKSCFIMGLPGAGKTSYLAALWHSLSSKQSTVLSIDRFDGDLSCISRISSNWADAMPVLRTAKREIEESVTNLILKSATDVFEVSFPDLSGETFQELYQNRVIEVSLYEYIQSANSALLFINLNEMYTPDLITSIPKHHRMDKDGEDGDCPIERDLRKDPTQVQLVELLQFVNFIRNDTPIRLGIIISAWDIIEMDEDLRNYSPLELVKVKLPLLWQYVIANKKVFYANYYGISAQGGDVEDERIRNSLLEISNPCDRIVVVNAQKDRYNDITLPLVEIVGELSEDERHDD